MALTMKDIVEDARKFVQLKQAEFKEGMAGEDPSTYPGAQHDKKVDESAKQPHPEVKQDLPPGGTTAAGAEEAEKVEAGHAKDSTQPAKASVTKEPAITSDAMAEPKTGSAKLANDLLTSVRALQETMNPAEAGNTKQAADSTATDGSDEKSEDKKKDSEEATNDDKEAQADNPLELTQDVLAKIASVILSSEEGWDFVEQSLTKEAGAEAARETITTLQKQAEAIEKQAAYDQGSIDAENLIQQAIQVKQAESANTAEAIYKAGAADAEAMIAGLQQQAQQPNDFQKLGQMMADESLAGLGGAEGGEGVVDDMAGAPEDEDITEEELMQALQELAAEGQIDQEDIQAIMEYITQADAATAGEEGGAEVPPEAAAALAGAGEEGAPEEGLDVAAAANDLQRNILGAISRVKAAKKSA